MKGLLQIPLSKRTFAYDPSGVRGNFLRKVNPIELTDTEQKRYVGRDQLNDETARRLPCGCILSLQFIQSWFAVVKSCPSCGVLFKMVKAPRRDVQAEQIAENLAWVDDDYSDVI